MSYAFMYASLKGHLKASYRHIVGRFIDATLIPLGLFASGVAFINVWAGLVLSSLWVSVRALMGVASRRPAPTVICSAILSISKIVVALLFMSPELWAYQGAAHTAVVGVAVVTASFLTPTGVSGVLTDIFPFLSKMLPFTYISFSRSLAVLWGIQQVLLAAANLVLLRLMAFETFYYAKPFLGWFMTVPTVLIGIVLLKRSVTKSRAVIPETTLDRFSGNS